MSKRKQYKLAIDEEFRRIVPPMPQDTLVATTPLLPGTELLFMAMKNTRSVRNFSFHSQSKNSNTIFDPR